MQKILTNKVRCLNCGDIIESTHRYDFKWCSCKTIAVDGGKEYLRRVGKLDQYEELSTHEEVEVWDISKRLDDNG